MSLFEETALPRAWFLAPRESLGSTHWILFSSFPKRAKFFLSWSGRPAVTQHLPWNIQSVNMHENMHENFYPGWSVRAYGNHSLSSQHICTRALHVFTHNLLMFWHFLDDLDDLPGEWMPPNTLAHCDTQGASRGLREPAGDWLPHQPSWLTFHRINVAFKAKEKRSQP